MASLAVGQSEQNKVFTRGDVVKDVAGVLLHRVVQEIEKLNSIPLDVSHTAAITTLYEELIFTTTATFRLFARPESYRRDPREPERPMALEYGDPRVFAPVWKKLKLAIDNHVCETEIPAEKGWVEGSAEILWELARFKVTADDWRKQMEAWQQKATSAGFVYNKRCPTPSEFLPPVQPVIVVALTYTTKLS